MSRRPIVVYWNNLPAPYMVDRFNALVDIDSIDFEAWFTDRNHEDRSWDINEEKWRFKFHYLPSIRIFGRRLHWPSRLFSRRPDVLVCLHSQPVYLLGIAIAKLRQTRLVIRVLKTFENWNPRTRKNELLKKIVFTAADAIETPGPDACEYVMRYGVAPNQVFELTHTISPLLLQNANRLTHHQIAQDRATLGLRGTTFIYVGRLWTKGKGLSYLLEAFRLAQTRLVNPISLVIAGDGPDERELMQLATILGCQNVLFVGFKQHSDLASILLASDVFVFPTLGDPYGIVIDEAMALGLPVISTDAVGEIRERIDDSITGYIVPAANSSAMAECMCALSLDPDARKRMGEQAKIRVSRNTPINWATDFVRMINDIVN